MGGPINPFTGRAPAYRDLPAATRMVIVGGLTVLGLLVLQVFADPRSDGLWIRAELTFAACLALVVGIRSIIGTRGRVRSVRVWITAAFGFWLLGEMIRNLEIIRGISEAPALADLPFVGVLACAGLAYSAALRGQLRPGEELSVYLDGAIVFFTTAALMVAGFGEVAARSPAGATDLAYAIFFLATTGATLLLDLAVRAPRGRHGAYVVLTGLVFFGAGFLVRVIAPSSNGMHEHAASAHMLSIGLVLVMLGTATWTDVMDDDPRFMRLAARLRASMPLAAIALTPILIAAHFVRQTSGPGAVVNIVAIGLVLVTVAIRQSVLLRDREAAVRRERQLSGELSVAEVKYRSLVERQPGVVYIAEPGPAGRWHFVSPQVEAMLGYAPVDWIADPELWARSLHPDDREAILSSDTAYGVVGDARRFEYRMIRRDGGTVWVLDDVAVTESGEGRSLLQGLLVDITAAKLAEEALRASEEQQRMILETASYAFVAIDDEGLVV